MANSAPLDSSAYGAEAGWWDDNGKTQLVSLCGVWSFCCAADLSLSLSSFVTLSVWPFKLCFRFAEMGMIIVYSSLIWWGGVNETIQMKPLTSCLGHRKDPACREALLLMNLTRKTAQLTTEHQVSQLCLLLPVGTSSHGKTEKPPLVREISGISAFQSRRMQDKMQDGRVYPLGKVLASCVLIKIRKKSRRKPRVS